MSGRLEQDRKIETKIKSDIKKQQLILREYSNSFGNKTASTKRLYINNVTNFLSFLAKEYDFDVSDINSFKALNYIHINAYMNYTKNHTFDGIYMVKEAGTCASEFYAIKHFCKFLLLCRYINENPCINVEVPRDKKQHEIVRRQKKLR